MRSPGRKDRNANASGSPTIDSVFKTFDYSKTAHVFEHDLGPPYKRLFENSLFVKQHANSAAQKVVDDPARRDDMNIMI